MRCRPALSRRDARQPRGIDDRVRAVPVTEDTDPCTSVNAPAPAVLKFTLTWVPLLLVMVAVPAESPPSQASPALPDFALPVAVTLVG